VRFHVRDDTGRRARASRGNKSVSPGGEGYRIGRRAYTDVAGISKPRLIGPTFSGNPCGTPVARLGSLRGRRPSAP
jgi:hypothetical protein